jgi:membrane protease YdiL (CAAX protease family)
MENKSPSIDTKRIAFFLAFAFGISWTTGLVIYLRGGLNGSPELVPESGITEAFVLLATAYMFAPAISHVVTRLITREGWQEVFIKYEFRRGWPYWLIAWFGTPLLLAIGALAYFVLFPQHFDANYETITNLIIASGLSLDELPYSPGVLAAIQIVQGILISPIVNLIPVFGEEFGWRAYLLPKLVPLGERKAYLLTGLIWGVWHAPVILMGYNYGLDYPGAPWAGTLLFIGVCFVLGTFFGWTSLRAGSVWPAVIGHAVLNGTASAAALFSLGDTNPLIGPVMVGVVGSLGFTLMTVWIFMRGVPDAEPEQSVVEAG